MLIDELPNDAHDGVFRKKDDLLAKGCTGLKETRKCWSILTFQSRVEEKTANGADQLPLLRKLWLVHFTPYQILIVSRECSILTPFTDVSPLMTLLCFLGKTTYIHAYNITCKHSYTSVVLVGNSNLTKVYSRLLLEVYSLSLLSVHDSESSVTSDSSENPMPDPITCRASC